VSCMFKNNAETESRLRKYILIGVHIYAFTI
jgi:hypothetical protein